MPRSVPFLYRPLRTDRSELPLTEVLALALACGCLRSRVAGSKRPTRLAAGARQ